MQPVQDGCRLGARVSGMGTSGGASHLLFAAGSNSGGQLALGHLDDAHRFSPCLCLLPEYHPSPSSFPPTGFEILSLSSGANHTAVIVYSSHGHPTRHLWFAGDRSQGQCGSIVDSSLRTKVLFTLVDIQALCTQSIHNDGDNWQPKSVACGWNSTFLVLEDDSGVRDGTLLALGTNNDFGELGIGQLPATASRTNQSCRPILLRQNLSAEAAQPQGRLVIHSLAAGLRHALVHFSIGETNHLISGWGAARHGELTPQCVDSEREGREDAVIISTVEKEEGAPVKVQWTPKTIIHFEARHDLAPPFVQLACGKQHSVILLRHQFNDVGRNAPQSPMSHTLWVAGAPQLIAQVQSRTHCLQPASVGSGWNSLTLVNPETNEFWSAGSNRHGQVANGGFTANGQGAVPIPEGCQIQSFACGSEHLVACFASKHQEAETNAWVWGWNEHGTLGCGDDEDRARPTRVERIETQHGEYVVQDVYAGCGTSFLQLGRVGM